MRIFIFCCAFFKLLEINGCPVDHFKSEYCPNTTQVSVGRFGANRWGRSNKIFAKWPNGILHYQVECNDFTPNQLELIESALNEIQNKTCVRFERIYNDTNLTSYVKLQCLPYEGCKSRLGYQGHPQVLNLETKRTGFENCIKYRPIQHEFLHALGFKHEHNSPTRDAYVRINYRNVKPGKEFYFGLDQRRNFNSYGCNYDYNSIMHVPSLKHSKNGLPTIEPLNPHYNISTIGIARSISECDVIRINNMYCKNNHRNL